MVSYRYTKGRFLATKLQDGMLNFYDLDSKEQELVNAFESQQSAKSLDRLLEQKRPPYRGVGTEFNISNAERPVEQKRPPYRSAGAEVEP